MPEVISVPRSDKKVELRLGGEDNVLSTNLGTIWNLLRPSWCPHSQASLNKEVTERVRLSPAKDEDLGILNVIHKVILPHRWEPKEVTSEPDRSVKKMELGIRLDLASGSGEHSCDGRSCLRIQSFQRGIWPPGFVTPLGRRRVRCK